MRIRLLGQFIHVSIAVLAVIEAALFFAVLNGAVYLRFHDNLEQLDSLVGEIWPRGLLFSGVMLVSVMSLGLYSARQRARAAGMIIRLALAVLAGVAVTAFAFYLLPDLAVGRGVLALAAIATFLLLVCSRVVFLRIIDEDLFKRRVLVYGSGNNAALVSRLRRRTDRRGFVLVGFVQPQNEPCEVPREMLVDPNVPLAALCDACNIDEVVVAMDDRRRSFPILQLLECRLAGVDVLELLSFLERETGRVRTDILNPSWMIFGEGFRRNTLRLVTARVVDIFASAIILALALPIMVLTAIAIKIEDGIRAPVFYKQPRVGLGGRIFHVYKFRSMRPNAEGDGKARWATKNDSRVTRVGALIRKVRIDELPQILCVLRSHMSFVGPRPERPEFVVELSEKIPYYVQRHCVKPGITGWAQLCYPYGSSEQDSLEKLQYDLYYIKNNSLLFDLAILLQTVEIVFMGQGGR